MSVAAIVSDGCRASVAPFVKATADKLRGRTKVKMRCGKPTTFAISLRGAASKAKSTITRAESPIRIQQQPIRVNPKRAFGKRVYRAAAGRVSKFIASSKLQKLKPHHSRSGNRALIIAIDF